MTDDRRPEDLKARMARQLEQELVERARARAASRRPEPEDASGPSAPTTLAARLAEDVHRLASQALRIPQDKLDPTENLANLGIDSIAITEVMARISRHFAITVAPTTFFEAKHLDDLAAILLARYGKAVEASYAARAPEPAPAKAAPVTAPAKPLPPTGTDAAADVPEAWLARHRAFAKGEGIAPSGEAARPARQPLATATATEEQVPIAVISMEGRFPQSPDLETFAAHLAAGDDCIEEVPADRWDWRTVHGDPKKGPFTDVKYGGFTPGHDLFDAGFFNISPREAELMDPQHRLFMECVWSLVEKAGHAPSSLSGRKVGLFLGINLLDYTDMVNRAGIMDAQQLTGLGHAFCPNRLSFLLDIHGPSSVIDTACSSSLVAIHRAIMSIRHEGCEMAIAGGSNLMLSPMQHIMFSQVGMITPDGRCKTFSAAANGYARADGVGAVLLKRLDLAERDGDPILGVIRASVEHHGGGATSLTAPNPKAQARLVAEAHRLAGIDPRSVSLIECHGTGTPLGDPVEVEGLKTAFAELYREHGMPAPAVPHIGLGSVKSNIGHAETAAGVAGLIKVLLAMRAGTLFRSLHCEEPNPLLELEGSPFYLLQAARHWDRPVVDGIEQPRRAGLSSFGAGGANVHMVIEEYRGPQPVPTPLSFPMIVPLSARTPDALAEAVRRLRPHVAGSDLGDLAWTLQVGRDAMRERIAFVARDTGDLLRQMDAVLAGADGDALRGSVPRGRRAEEMILDPIGRDPLEVARAWVGGASVDWQRLHAGTARRRLALPSYPFQRKRYWLPLEAAPVAPASGLSPQPSGAGTFEIELTGHEFFLADHRIGGRPVLPGVAYLDLVRAAAVKAGLEQPLLRQVVWMSPLAVEKPVRVRIVFTPAADGARRAEVLSVASGEEPRLHAQMLVADGVPQAPAAADLAALSLAHPRTIPAERVYAAFDAMGLAYGPGHRAILSLAIGPDADGARSVLGHLRLPEVVAHTASAFALHPSLMDGAFQAAIGLVMEEDGTAPKGAALPFAIEAVEIFGPLETDLWVHIQSRPASGGDPRTRRMDLLLLDDAGNARIALRGFATRSYVEAPPQDTPCFVPVWRPVEGKGTTDQPARHLVLVAPDAVKWDDLAPHLPGVEVVDLAGGSEDGPAMRFEAAALQLLDVLKAQSGRALVQVLLPGEEGHEALSGLVGLLRSAAREHAGLTGQLIALEPGLDPASVVARLLQAASHLPLDRFRARPDSLAAEMWEEAGGTVRENALPLRDDGVYLITGGTGGLGRHLAGAILAAAPNAKVVLAGRSAAALHAENGFSYSAADLSDPKSTQALVDGVRARHGRLDGIFHAAGVLCDEALQKKTATQLREVFAPKVRGLVNLDRALGAAPLDFLVLFSSISGVLGNPGQADYGAANAFLDGFAEDREARRRRGDCHGRTLSVAWPLWRDGGMGMDAATEALMRRTTGLVPLETGAGLGVLAGLLAGEIAPGAARVLVTVGERERIRDLVCRKSAQPPAKAESAPKPAAAASKVDTGDLRLRVLRAVTEEAGAILKVALDDLDPDVELTEYGFDSISFTQFANRLNDRFGLDLTPTLFFEHPVLETLAAHLAEHHAEAMIAVLGGAPAPQVAQPVVPAVPAPAAAPTPATATVFRPAAVAETASGAVAIIGMSGIFPGAADVASFWQNLVEGRDCISEVPSERWDWRDWWGDPQREPGRTNVKWGGFIGERLAEFDAAFFGISAPEARMIDPQQRLLLTEAWRVMEDAGYAPSRLAGSRTGVFLGTADTGYSRLVAASGSGVEGYSMTGLAPSLGPNRISYFYDFHGPSIAVETACSSALVAVHRAVEAIHSGHCDAAIAGGINALLLPEAFVGFSRAGMLSPDGRSKPFSDAANGYARGEGVGLVFLKPLEAAERDGDDIIAVIRASAENHGGHAASLTAPNPKAQGELLRSAYSAAGFDPRTVGYIEAHGTGTPLGDPIEVEALSAAFADLARDAEGRFGAGVAPSCGIGSVKSNIGHLELAAGIAGLIKVLLQIRHGRMAATLHCDRLNPYLKLEGSPFFVVREAQEWPRARDASGRELPRRAGVSSFGFGGSNAHVVLEEHIAAPVAQPADTGTPAVLVLSARSEDQLRTMASDLRRYLDEAGEAVSLADVAHTLQVARDAMEHRLAFVASGRTDAIRRLGAFLAGEEMGGLHLGRVRANRAVISVLEGDADLRQAAAGLVSRGRHDELLALWVRGLDVDWTQLPGSAGRRRVRLPGYPFARTRHWVRGSDPAPAATASLRLEGSESFLRDHLVGGRKVLPGVVQFELVRAELERRGRVGLPLEFTGHTWLRPVVVDGAPVRVEVELDAAGERYRVLTSGHDGRQVHGEGRVRAAPDIVLPLVDLDTLRRGMPGTVDPAGLYARFEALGLGYGPAHRAITRLATGEGRVLARLEFPAAATDGMVLHPSMLDGALQSLLALAAGDDAALAVPYALRRLLVLGPTEPVMWAVGERDGATHTVRLCDETGRVLVLFEGFAARAVSAPPSIRPPVEEAPSARPAEMSAVALGRVTAIAARVLEVDPSVLDTETELGEFGFDSITMTGFAAAINDELDLSLTPADFFEFATLARLARHVAALAGSDLVEPLPAVAGLPPAVEAPRPAAGETFAEDDPVVIVGLSCAFPMARNADAFWQNLVSARDCITRIPPDRWDWQQVDGDPKADPGKTNIHWGGFIDGVFEFDPLFFSISPREARLMDPQQRLMMMHAWNAIEDAGHSPRDLAGRKVGIFVGTSTSGYRDLVAGDTGGDGYVATGAVASVGPNRISYFLDLHGPSEPVETACSSSLVALHRAVRSIRDGDCEMALVGGVNTIVTPEAHINFAKAGMLSPDGRCKTFSAHANGYVRGEGAGMLFVRRLSDALRDGDPILAVVRGTAINHGGRANSLTAPNTEAQADLLRAAYRDAGIDPSTIGYIEAHGTGTALGDPVEINALKSAFSARAAGDVCGIGSVKTNIGHLELAAGIAGVAKVLLQMRHRQLVPSLHCETLNPYIELAGTPFDVVRQGRPWTAPRDAAGRELPLRAGVSSFGFGGVNAHVVLEDYPSAPPSVAAAPAPQLIVLSARDAARLEDRARDLAEALESGRFTDADLADIAFTLRAGRAPMKQRLAFVARSLADAVRMLKAYLGGASAPGLLVGNDAAPTRGPVPEPAGLEDWARHFAQGGDLTGFVETAGAHRRVRLPTYPFARDVYRVGGSPAPARPAVAAQGATVSEEIGGPFARRLEASAFYLRDHRFRDMPILPAAMGLELARNAFVAAGGRDPVRLEGVTWRRPLELASGSVEVRLPLEEGEAGAKSFRLLSGIDTEHMRGSVSSLPVGSVPPRFDIAARRGHCPRGLDRDWLYASYAALGLSYGPAFRCVVEMQAGEGEALARLRLPEAARGGETFHLHPSMLDAAFHAALCLFHGEPGGTAALPFALDRMDVFGPTDEEMWAHLREQPAADGLRRIDIDLADRTGTVRVAIRGFTLRLVRGAPSPDEIRSPAKPETSAALVTAAERYLAEVVARETGIPVAEIDPEAALEAYGIDSLLITRLTDELGKVFGPLSSTLFFEHQTIASLAGHFASAHPQTLSEIVGAAPADARPAIAALAAPPARERMGEARDEPIAIIGLAGRYPGARDVEAFWQNLAAGRDSITEIPAERWDHARFHDPEGRGGLPRGKWGGFVEDFDRFDPLFFNIAPREAPYIDPQERLFLQCAWETLEDAGYTRESVAPAADGMAGGDVGVFVGVMYEEYQLYGAESTAAGRPLALSGSAASIANRVSYFCDFHGPSMAVDSMCSSSLTAIHLACEALRAGDCSVALAGGVNLTLHPNKYLALAQGRFLSSTGRCESFGEGGDGYVPGEGVGAVLLKPLSRAIADGDRIHGVIRASALNHGGKTNGYTVPNPLAQAAVIGRAIQRAGVRAGDVGYVEAHGTGTSLGDPIEIAALSRAYRRETDACGFCAIGSVKSNIGHGESAAGIAGLTKVLLQFRHGRLAPSLHSATPNREIDFAASPFRVQQRLEDWPRRRDRQGNELPHLAALSSFGAGGSNAHLIIEDYPAPAPREAAPSRTVYPFSAREAGQLRQVLERFRARLDTLSEADLPAAVATLQDGREAFEERLAIVAGDRAELVRLLDAALADTGDIPGIWRGRAARGRFDDTLPASLEAAAAAWVTGARVDWRQLRGGARPVRIGLPTYPFARERYWLPEGAAVEHREISAPALPLLFRPHWQEKDLAAAAPPSPGRHVVVLCGAPDEAASRLRSHMPQARIVQLESQSGDQGERFADHAAQLLALLKEGATSRSGPAVLQLVLPVEDTLAEGLAGLLRCARLEHRDLACQAISLDPVRPDLAGLLAREASVEQSDHDIRYSRDQRLVRTWQEIETGAKALPVPWKPDGVYLVTGGAGGVGLHVAAEIVARALGATVWLIGRSARHAALEETLARLGPRAVYRQADVTDRAAMQALVPEIRAVHGRLDGVVHAAGLTRDSLIANKSEADLRAVLAPKVAGTLALDAALGSESLDFLLLFASASGALGNAGQADYAAANAFLDAFAQERNQRVGKGECWGHTLSIDWPYWQDGGMRLPGAVVSAMERQAGAAPLATDAALATLAFALQRKDDDQLLVLSGDKSRLRALVQPSNEGMVAPPPPFRSAAVPVQAAAAETVARDAVPSVSEAVVDAVRACFAEVLKIPAGRLGADETIDRFGVDSVSALDIVAALETRFGSLPQTLLFEHPTIARLAAALEETGQGERTATREDAPAPAPIPAVPAAKVGGIAVIAVAGRFPGARTVEEFWQALEEGRDCVREVPAERWDVEATWSPRKGRPLASHCRWGGFIDDVDRFDAGFFGYSPREAALADPQERLFLETTWHLLERAGHTRAWLGKRYGNRVGVFVGAMYQHYKALEMDAESRALLLLSSYSAIANRTSFVFDLQGPSVAVDSMCSSGLQAVHQACQSLATGECRLAIAGGVNLSLLPEKYVGLSQAGLVGSHAASRSFAGGDGYLPSEGVGAVLLKPLDDALADGDTVLAVIRASMANHAGHSAGYAVPNVDAQTRLLAENLEAAGIDPRSIGYVEAAANGSSIGDAIELRALGRVFAGAQNIPLGSVKANLGHAEAASGMAQLTRVLLQFQYRRLVPSPGLPGVEAAGSPFAGTPFVPQLRAEPWHPRVVDGEAQPLRASVSSFGAGGSNVHLVLEEAPPAVAASTDEPAGRFRFPVSARTPDQLAAVLRQLADFVRSAPDLSLARLSRTLRFGRETMACGIELTAFSAEELVAGLEAAATDPPAAPLPQATEEGDRSGLLVLPGYPFARERHWIGTLPATPSPEPEARSTASDAAPLETLRQTVAAIRGVSPSQVPTDRPLRDLGVESMGWMRLVYAVEEAHGCALTHADLDRHPTLAALAARIASNTPDALPVATPSVMDGPWRAPLGEGQKGLWVLQTLYPGRTDYNVPLAFRVSGIDEPSLSRACDWLCESFPVLTARVAVQGEMLEASTAPRLETLSIPKEIEPAEFARRRLARPFDLAKDAPVRFELLQGGTLGPGESLLLVTFHHIAIDGASAAVAARLLWQAYSAFVSGGAPASPAAANRADYADFIAWEREMLASPRGEEQLRYWREVLSGELPGLDLPADRDALAAETGRRDGAVEHRLPRALVARMREVLLERGTSPAAFHLAVFSVLLYRHTGQEDLIVGVPTLRRPQRRFEETIGYCANMMALRIAVDGELPAAVLLETAQRALGEGLARADVPFAAVAQGLGGSADGQAPWQVGYAYQNFPQGTGIDLPPELGRVEHLPQIRQPGDTPFGLEVYEEGSGLLLVASFDGERFSAARIERMLGHYQTLAGAMLDDLETPLGELAMLTRAERERSLYSWSATTEAAPAAGLVHEWIEARLRQGPSAEVLGGQGETLTARQLLRQVERLCLILSSCGIRQGDRVAVLAGREAGGIAGLLSVLASGAVWVPLDPEHPDERLSLILRDAGATLVLAPKGLAARARKLAASGVRVVRLDRDGWDLRPQLARRRPVVLRPEDPAYIIYTSGSTGTPKGVVVSHGALAGHCRAVVDHYGLGERDAVLQFASPGVDTALEQILPALASGARLVIGGTAVRAPSDFLKLLERERITVADLPPVYLRELLQAWKTGGAELSGLSLRLLICGGEALGPDVVALWADSDLKRARLLNAYGPTEATITALVHDVTPDDRFGPVPIGRPLAGTRIYILDPHGNPVPDGVVGELHIGGARLAIGYHGRDDLTRERFVLRTIDPGEPPVRLYRTGDLAAFLPNSGGTVAFHGRIDDQVKIRGFRVEPGEVEAALAAEGLGEVVVLAEADGEGRAFLAAFVAAPEAGFDAAALRDRLSARLPLHMLPSMIHRIDALPVAPGGKVDRRALRRLAARPTVAQDAADEIGQLDDVEALLRDVWARALGREAGQLRRGDRFSDSGGDSLAAVRLLGGIERAFGLTLSVADLGAAATLGEQARLLRQRLPAGTVLRKEDTAAKSSLVVPLRIALHADAPALFLVHPVGGTVACYAGLAAALPEHWSVHGIRASGLVAGDSPEVTSLPALASRYIEQLRAMHPAGPYRLAGWSMGGVLAFEMARQLQAAGERVDFLALLDSYTPQELARVEPSLAGDATGPGEIAEQACRAAFVRDLLGGETVELAAGADLADQLLAMPAFARRHPGMGAADLRRLFAVFAANQAALADYQPGPCAVPLTLVRTWQGLERFGGAADWQALAHGGFVLHEAAGDHHSFLQPPHLQGWAGHLSQALMDLKERA
ncbi:non-ribosomal peptide synthetase [Stappia indica]|uniref:Amino acid adenylation domain-containing protein n=1 Tax=Stappia indica TaxID=538381 RepID=A0A857CE07_9HYPH|nr:non-ribosomal peptide synthetase [Stappia indica]QGZ36672.1 amino acid adenylation domain-containing protein [Stappia indica]